MADNRQLGIYLSNVMRGKVEAGRKNFVRQTMDAYEELGVTVSLYENTPEQRASSHTRPGYSLFQNDAATHDRALSFRLAYLMPFWRIERAQTRGGYLVAGKEFEALKIDGDEANQFLRLWRRKLKQRFPPKDIDLRDFVFIPLQSDLATQQADQSMSAIDMISATLVADRFRKVVIKLRPSKIYSDVEMAALDKFQDNPRISFSNAQTHTLLEACEYIVTQNSAAAFEGLFHRKPAILFADSDFHHICQNVKETGVDRAFRNVLATRIPSAKYLLWFLQINAINAGKPGAGARAIEICRDLGWKI